MEMKPPSNRKIDTKIFSRLPLNLINLCPYSVSTSDRCRLSSSPRVPSIHRQTSNIIPIIIVSIYVVVRAACASTFCPLNPMSTCASLHVPPSLEMMTMMIVTDNHTQTRLWHCPRKRRRNRVKPLLIVSPRVMFDAEAVIRVHRVSSSPFTNHNNKNN